MTRAEMSRQPNVILILADDLGFSDIGCYGSEIATPNLDALARRGVRASAFYNTARCSPSRASLLTGRHPHETGIGILTENLSTFGAYPGTLSLRFATLAELLKREGYRTCLAGKWHLSHETQVPNESWPTRRGFDHFFGIMPGADSYFHPRNLWRNEEHCETPRDGFYLTDAISDYAVDFVSSTAASPFFLYLAYTAPHWPLHAKDEDIEGYPEIYAAGWDELRERRHRRLCEEGVIGEESGLSERDPSQRAWSDTDNPEWQARRMSVYAAQVQSMDEGIGRVLRAVEQAGDSDDTLVIFLSDNGASAEELPPPNSPHFASRQPTHTPDNRPLEIGNRPEHLPGPGSSFASYGRAWANLSNTPFRLYKRWVHEGGISTPFIATWPNGGLTAGDVMHEPHQLTDVLPTVLEAVGAPAADGPGLSMLDAWRGTGTSAHPLFWEHVGNAAARDGRWKIVREADRPWELYDMDDDRSERHDLAGVYPGVVEELAAQWEKWAHKTGVLRWEALRSITAREGN